MRKNLILLCALSVFALLAIAACEKRDDDCFTVEDSAQVKTVYVADIWECISGEYSGNFTSSEIRRTNAEVQKNGESSLSIDFGQVKLKNGLPKASLKFDNVCAKKQKNGVYTFSGETVVVINDYIVPGTVYEFEATLVGHSDSKGKLSFEISSPEHNLTASFVGSK